MDLFKQHFGYRPAHVATAPGKIELLGSFAEATRGLALTAAVDRYVRVAVAPRTDGKIEVIHADRAPEIFWISNLAETPGAEWTDLFKAVLRELRRRKVHFSGFNAAIHSDIPTGLGLGENAATAVAAALAVRKLFPFSLGDSGATVPPWRNERGELPPLPPAEKLQFARVCSAALAAVRCDDGLVGAMTSLAGKKWNLLNLDCQFGSLEHTPFIGTALIVCDSGARRSEAGKAAAKFPEHCASAIGKLGIKSLRSLEPRQLRAMAGTLDVEEFKFALHVTGEIQRVAAAERALREEDHRQVGNYLSLSHESLRENLGADRPEMEVLAALARAHSACLGARTLGDGGGGATVNLVAYHAAEPFVAHIARHYEAKTGRKLAPFVCQIVDGAF